MNKGWTKNSINRLLVKFGTADRRLGSGRRSAHTDENVDTVESLLLSQEDKPQSQEKFHMRLGIHRSFVSQIIHKVLLLKCYKKRGAQQLTESHSMHVLFSVCSLRDYNAIRSKPRRKPKHADSILEPSEYFYQISSKSIHTISSYTVAKLGHFFETQCSFQPRLRTQKSCELVTNKLETSSRLVRNTGFQLVRLCGLRPYFSTTAQMMSFFSFIRHFSVTVRLLKENCGCQTGNNRPLGFVPFSNLTRLLLIATDHDKFASSRFKRIEYLLQMSKYMIIHIIIAFENREKDGHFNVQKKNIKNAIRRIEDIHPVITILAFSYSHIKLLQSEYSNQ